MLLIRQNENFRDFLKIQQRRRTATQLQSLGSLSHRGLPSVLNNGDAMHVLDADCRCVPRKSLSSYFLRRHRAKVAVCTVSVLKDGYVSAVRSFSRFLAKQFVCRLTEAGEGQVKTS